MRFEDLRDTAAAQQPALVLLRLERQAAAQLRRQCVASVQQQQVAFAQARVGRIEARLQSVPASSPRSRWRREKPCRPALLGELLGQRAAPDLEQLALGGGLLVLDERMQLGEEAGGGVDHGLLRDALPGWNEVP